MIQFHCKGILLDIEGTTSSIRFVYDEMFPYVRRELNRFLNSHWTNEQMQAAAELVAHDAGSKSFAEFCKSQPNDDPIDLLCTEVLRQMDGDLKLTGLKQLQGLIWKDGFESGELKAHLYPEVSSNLRKWHSAGISLRIYSSGSIAAQKLFFGNSIEGDLLHLFEGFDDTTTGGKKVSESYRIIAEKFGHPNQELLFISDVTEELDAAADAGFQTCWSCRPENPDGVNERNHPTITSFDEITVDV